MDPIKEYKALSPPCIHTNDVASECLIPLEQVVECKDTLSLTLLWMISGPMFSLSTHCRTIQHNINNMVDSLWILLDPSFCSLLDINIILIGVEFWYMDRLMFNFGALLATMARLVSLVPSCPCYSWTLCICTLYFWASFEEKACLRG